MFVDLLLCFPSAFPNTSRSSNNLYDGTNGFGPTDTPGLLAADVAWGSPALVGNELDCCRDLPARADVSVYDAVALARGV